jgi:hypothetical protein
VALETGNTDHISQQPVPWNGLPGIWGAICAIRKMIKIRIASYNCPEIAKREAIDATATADLLSSGAA